MKRQGGEAGGRTMETYAHTHAYSDGSEHDRCGHRAQHLKHLTHTAAREHETNVNKQITEHERAMQAR